MTLEAASSSGRRLTVSDVNSHVTCRLCHGYLIDATTLKQCIHSFCRSCIVRYLQSNDCCPVCHVTVVVPGTDRRKLSSVLRPDRILQALTYKLIPGLYKKEERLRLIFAESHPTESSYCARRKVVLRRRPIISQDDNISICLRNSSLDSRYLLCPAALTVGILKQFIAAKFSLSQIDHLVRLQVSENILDDDQTLLNVMYIERWNPDDCLVLDYDVICRQSTTSVTSSESINTSTDISVDVNISPAGCAATSATSSDSVITDDYILTLPNESTFTTAPTTQTTNVYAPVISIGLVATSGESKRNKNVDIALAQSSESFISATDIPATPSESKIRRRVCSSVETLSKSRIIKAIDQSINRSSPVRTGACSAAVSSPKTPTGPAVASSPRRTPAGPAVASSPRSTPTDQAVASSSQKTFVCPAIVSSPRTPARPAVSSLSMSPSCTAASPRTVLKREDQSISHRERVKRNNGSPIKSDQKKHCPASRTYSNSIPSTSLWTTCARTSASPRVTTVDKSLSPRVTPVEKSSPHKVASIDKSLSPKFMTLNMTPTSSIASTNMSPSKGTMPSLSKEASSNIPSSPRATLLNMPPKKDMSFRVSPSKVASSKVSLLNRSPSPKSVSLHLSPSKTPSFNRSPFKVGSYDKSPRNSHINNCHESNGDVSSMIEESKCTLAKQMESSDDSSHNELSAADNSQPQTSVVCSSDDGLTISASVTVVINRGQNQQQIQQPTAANDVDSLAVTKAKRKQRSLEAIVSALRPKSISSPVVGVSGLSNKGTIRFPITSCQDVQVSTENTANGFDEILPLHEQNYKLQCASRLVESLHGVKNNSSNGNVVKLETTGKRHFASDDPDNCTSKVSANLPPIKRFKQMAAPSSTYLPRAVSSVVSNQRVRNGIYSGALTDQLTHFTRLQQQQQQQQHQLSYINGLRAPNASNVYRTGNMSNNSNANALDSSHSASRSNDIQNSVCPPFWFGSNASTLSQQFLQQHQFQQMMRQQGMRQQGSTAGISLGQHTMQQRAAAAMLLGQQAMKQQSSAPTPFPALSSTSSISSGSLIGRSSTLTQIHPAFALPNGYDAPIELTTQHTRERQQTNAGLSSKLSRSHATITALLQRK